MYQAKPSKADWDDAAKFVERTQFSSLTRCFYAGQLAVSRLCNPDGETLDVHPLIKIALQAIIDHYEGVSAGVPPGKRPLLTDVVDAAKAAQRHIQYGPVDETDEEEEATT